MNIGFFTCCMMSVIFLISALIFALLKEKAAMLISGFNTLPKEKRAQYDTEKMSLDHRNLFFSWGILFAIGAVLSYFLSQYAAAVVFVVWLILFFREVHLDAEKAFGKYKKS